MTLELPLLTDDGLLTPTIGRWGLTKYRLVKTYADMFATSMLGKWDTRIYIDLFAGPGRARIKRTSQIVPGSPLVVIDIQNPFDKYVFCEIVDTKLQTLRTRITKDYSHVNTQFIPGNANTEVKRILAAIPPASRQHRVLSFCFADPFRLQDLHFSTIKRLASLYIDFLVLIPAYMDAHRNSQTYLHPDSTRVERFLGLADWRSRWIDAQRDGMKFGTFVADQFGKQMASLQYAYRGLQDTVLISEPLRNKPLYRLAFFSRNPLGVKFWDQARRYSTQQLPLFE